MDHFEFISVDIRSIDLQQAIEFVNFHNAYYRTERTPHQWLWQYKNYFPEKAVFTVSRDKGKLIATQAMMPIYMEIGGKTILTAKSENTLLLPEYRGKKIMSELYEFAVKECQSKEIQFIWGFTKATKAFRKFGFSVFTSPKLYSRPGSNIFLPLMYRFQRPVPIWRKIAMAGKFIQYYIKNVTKIYRPKIIKKPGYEINNRKIKTQDLKNLFLKRIKSNNCLISVKLDDKFLNWRIRHNPILEYQEYQVTKDGSLSAYAFVTSSLGEASISDLGANNDYDCQLLLSQIIADYSMKSGQFNIVINPECRFSIDFLGILHKFGFKVADTWNLVIRNISNQEEKTLEDISNWNISGLMSEGYTM